MVQILRNLPFSHNIQIDNTDLACTYWSKGVIRCSPVKVPLILICSLSMPVFAQLSVALKTRRMFCKL